MHWRLWLSVLLWACVAAFGVPAPAIAQTPAAAGVTQAQVAGKLKDLEATQGLDEAQKTKLTETYHQATSYLESAQASAVAAAAHKAAVDSAPRETQSIRATLARPEPAAAASADLRGLSTDTPVAELEQRLARQKADLATAEAKLADLEKDLAEQQGRPPLARQELTDARQVVDELRQEQKAPLPAGDPAVLNEARRLLAGARLQAKAAEVTRLEQELASQGVRVDLLVARRDLAAREVTAARERVRLLDDLINQSRRAQAAQAVQQASQAEQAAAEKDPAIRQLAEANARTSEQLAASAVELEKVTAAREVTQAQVKQIEQDFQSARQKLEVAGLSEALGKILIEQRNRLPNTRRGILGVGPLPLMFGADWQERLGEVGLAQVQVEEERRALADPSRALDRLMAEQVPQTLPSAEREAIRGELLRLLTDRRGLLQQLGATQAAFLRALGELEFAHRQLISVVRAYREFLNEHLLWTPSIHSMGTGTPRALVDALGWFLSPGNWLQVVHLLTAELLRVPVPAGLTLLGLAGLVRFALWLRARVTAANAKIGKPTTDRFAFTVEGLVDTVLLALPLPIVMWLVGWRLQVSLDATDFTQAVGAGLLVAAPSLLNAHAVLRLCGPEGVAAVHFGWPEAALRQLRVQLRLLISAGLPLVLVAATSGAFESEAHRGSLGRLAFLGVMVVLALVLQRILRPHGAVLRAYLAEHSDGWLYRLRHAWYPVAVGIPLILAVLAALGYYYSAGELAVRLVDTLWLVMGAVVIQSLVLRWLTVTRRRVALDLARERRDAALAAREVPEAGPPPEPATVDLAAVDAQTRRLLRAVILLAAPLGLWLIWSDVLPALNILEKVHLWDQTQAIDGVDKRVPVTLGDLALALLIGLITIAAARNFPGVLEIAVLRHTGLEAGSRYAVRKGTSYLIAAVGGVLAVGTLGLSWSQIQWLVAALGVGLGFGLQEIFANFISGLIILFERPVRVGDTVTVGELSGTVARIRFRATTIADFDHKEIIVPNKSFITERVVNWTLSDAITRVKVRVGVAYGSDTALAHQAILKAVRSVPLVRRDPAPSVYFMGFGESSLDFDIYVFASELADRLPIAHEIHMAVERTLRAHGIEIPFPQRDIRIRLAPELAPATLAPEPEKPPPGVRA